jgi:dolichol-phosphate mannosyltransferase
VLALTERLAEGYDVAIASRFRPGGGQIGVPRSRAVVSRVANLLMRLIFPIPGVREYTCGLRAYRARVIQDAIGVFGNDFIQLRGLGFTSTPEILVKLHLLGCRFAEVPFVLRYDLKRGPSRMVGSVTTIGYAVMAVLHHWPWGGWRTQFRGLRSLYSRHPEQAVASFGSHVLERRPISRIGV